jgi:hypothetical protein
MYLGRVLDDYLQLPEMARRAREGHFDDFFAPPEVADGFELIRLVKELNAIARGTNRVKRLKIREVVAAVKNGEFDATEEESARWEASADGQAAMKDDVAVALAEHVLECAKDPKAIEEALRAVEKLVGEDE